MEFTFTENKSGFSVANRNKETIKTIMPLTNREKEVLQILAKGLTAPEIARELFVSHYTVETHRRNIIQKLQASNIVDAVVKAMRMGVIE